MGQDESSIETVLENAKIIAEKLIQYKRFNLHAATRLYAKDICTFACAKFDPDWHCANWNRLQMKESKRMHLRCGQFQNSCLADAYHDKDVFDIKMLLFVTKCVAAASLILASILCVDEIVTEQQLASHLFANFFDSAGEQAKKIRHYGYYIFAILADGCPSRISSVQHEFILCQNQLFGTNNKNASKIFTFRGTSAMLEAISDNNELGRRYSKFWLGKACTILAQFAYCRNYLTEINCKKMHYFRECVVDCALVCQLAKHESVEFIKYYVNVLGCQNKKRTRLGHKKNYIKQRWIREFFTSWDLKKTFLERKLDRKYYEQRLVEKKTDPKLKRFVELRSKNETSLVEDTEQHNLGSGAYGHVSTINFENQVVAVKNFLCATDRGPWLNDIHDALQEINALRFFQNQKGIVEMHFALLKFSEKSKEIKEIQMLMPLYKCDLHTWIKRQQTVGEVKFVFQSQMQFFSFVVQLAQGLTCMHQSSFMHRDIKTLNILISDDEKSVVWSDLGAAMYLYNGNAHEHYFQDAATYWWKCPESLMQNYKTVEMSPAYDIWSFGVCIVEMILGHIPFQVDENILDLQLEQCSFALKNDEEDEFGIIEKCKERNLLQSKKKSQLRRNIYKQLDKKCAAKISNYIFEKIIYLLPSKRASAKDIAQFFSNLKE